MNDIHTILKNNLYIGLVNISPDMLTLKRVNNSSLNKLVEGLTTFQCYRFATYIVSHLFSRNLKLDILLANVYCKEVNCDTYHIFYLVVLLCVSYFKDTTHENNQQIVRMLLKIQSISENKQPFHELYVTFSRRRSNELIVNNHTRLFMSKTVSTTTCNVSEPFRKMKKMISHASRFEYLPSPKVYQHMNSLCNFAYKYHTSNRLLQNSKTKMMKEELFYPKVWLDFAYAFQQNVIENTSAKRSAFHALKMLLLNPFETENLSFSHYMCNIISHLAHFLNNKIISMNVPGCFCHAKCVAGKGNLEKIYYKGLFILCKTCCQPVNYQQKIYNKTNVQNDAHNHQKYFACADCCSQFDIIDLYKCFIDERGCINYQYLALLKLKHTKRRNICTTMCQGDRKCYNIVTFSLDNCSNGNISCGAHTLKQHSYEEYTCFDVMSQKLQSEDIVTKTDIHNTMCQGCIAYCFDICTRNDERKRKIRSLLGK